MVQFKTLRLQGFKSFVERTEMEIAPGLNGIVGPNGCGKSNLVEALRWVMGESSAKRMRGGGMEDVIFSGTTTRSSRNIAQVTLLLDNTHRRAPATYNKEDDIEIIRKIERDRGSLYKINGKTVRARDVQMLFADTVTGANSPALVSQGRIAQIINAKPQNRRQILEESAGISGLYARRHEAELRLKAADRNLVRIEDILGGMEGRLSALKRQARQAARYKNIGAQIRQFEILIAWLEYQALEERRKDTQDKFNEAEAIAAQKLVVVTQLTKTQNTQMQDLPPLRQKEAEASAAWQTQNLALQRLEDDAVRLKQDLENTIAQISETQTDMAHETQELAENEENLKRLKQEQKTLQTTQNDAHKKLAKKQTLRDELEAGVLALEERYSALMQGEAETRARQQALTQQISRNAERLITLQTRKAQAEDDLKTLENTHKNVHENDTFLRKIKTLENNFEKETQEIKTTKISIEKERKHINTARKRLKNTEHKYTALETEISMLKDFMAREDHGDFKPVLDLITPEAGFENAVSRALGDGLMASLEKDAPSYWFHNTAIKPGDLPALPDDVSALLNHVKSPDELKPALSQIGYVQDDITGQSLAQYLKPGQALVSSDGTYWRWDGYTMKADATDRNAQLLEHKNKLQDMTEKCPTLEKSVNQAQTTLNKHEHTQKALEDDLEKIELQHRNTVEILNRARAELSQIRESQARLDSEKKNLTEVIKISSEDIKTLEEVIKWDQDRLNAHEQESKNQKTENIEDVKAQLADVRASYQNAIRAFDQYQQTQNSRKARLHAIADEHVNLKNRTIRARERLKQLNDRQTNLQIKHDSLEAQPRDFDTTKDNILSAISTLEENRNKAAEDLAATEQSIAETAKALKRAESILSEAREARAHAQATLSGIQERCDTIRGEIRNDFDLEPQNLAQHITVNTDKNPQDLPALKDKKDTLIQERDRIGPVNLRAEEEAQSLEKDCTVLLHERNDLIKAIGELRSAIRTINKEARERLIVAFEHVNTHFENLFTRLFRGGKAYLKLIDSDDPLEAGLEIYAQPPGKALQSLSLLSGGEQALTAIALIFGMFLTNPSPVCVLDEIDAPLDDANVERVCDLLDEIAARGDTRFIIITHHRLTMARMDRLYGVTMSEKGVSQLVSVDLQQSFDFLEAA